MAKRGIMFSFTLHGQKELMAAFDALPKVAGQAVLRRLAKKALIPVRDAARSMAPRDQGDLADSIAIHTKLTKSQKKRAARAKRGDVVAYVGPSWPKGAAGVLEEFGTGPRYTKTGAFRGVNPPRPFLRPAWDANRERVLDVMREGLWAELKKEAKKLNKKAQAGKLGRAARRHLGGF